MEFTVSDVISNICGTHDYDFNLKQKYFTLPISVGQFFFCDKLIIFIARLDTDLNVHKA